MRNFDVLIVGAGPAGIFAAYELTKNSRLSVLIVEKGSVLTKRMQNHSYAHIGWGGAGAFSDGKLNLSTEVGGWLTDYITKDKLAEYIDYADSIYRRFGAPNNIYGTNLDKIDEIERKAAFAGLKLIHQKIRHMGTDQCLQVLRNMRRHLKDKVDIQTGVEVKSLDIKGDRVEAVETEKGEKVEGKYVIV